MEPKTIFLHYGEGGHRAEIERLHSLFGADDGQVRYIGLCEGAQVSDRLKNYKLLPMRSKYNRILSVALLPWAMLYNLCKITVLLLRYRPAGLVSTGPGSILLPAAVFKLFHKKVVYIETGCRFYSRSLSGKYVSRLADKFYVQNRELLDSYPDAIYGGML